MTLRLMLSPSRALCASAVLAIYAGVAISAGRASASASEDNPFCRHRVRTVTVQAAAPFLTGRSSYLPGESAVFRVDNVGGLPIRLIGEYFALERFVNGEWSVAPESPKVFSRIRLGILEPGKSG